MPQRRSYGQSAKKSVVCSKSFLSEILKISGRKAACFTFALGILLLGLWISHEIRDVAKEIEQLQSEMNHLSAQNQEFSSKKTLLTRHDQLKELGKKLRLHPPTNSQVITLH